MKGKHFNAKKANFYPLITQERQYLYMKIYDRNKPLISIHIPKTGGTSLEFWLRRIFKGKVYLHYSDEKNGQMPRKYELKPGICIHGHFNKRRKFGIQDYYPEVDQFIMFLRDPFEILVSRYYDVKSREKKGTAFRDGKHLILTDDILQYLKTEIPKPDYHPNILDYMPVEVTTDNYKQVIHKYFIYVGLIEDFQFSVDRLADKFQVPPQTLDHLNLAQRSQTIPIKYRKQFMELHPLELEIYTYVLKNYKKW